MQFRRLKKVEGGKGITMLKPNVSGLPCDREILTLSGNGLLCDSNQELFQSDIATGWVYGERGLVGREE